MGVKAAALALVLAGQAAAAQQTSFNCFGTEPSWSLSTDGVMGTFEYIGQIDLTVPHSTRAEGRAWPLVMTLVSSDFATTAILLVHERACNMGGDQVFDFESQVLTQRQDTPVVLSGCCRATGS